MEISGKVEAVSEQHGSAKIGDKWINNFPKTIKKGSTVKIDAENKNGKYYFVKPISVEEPTEEEEVNLPFLLNKAHAKGIVSLESEPVHIDYEKKLAVFKTTVTFKDGSKFSAHGDAFVGNEGKDKGNLTAMITPHWIRMGESRAIARCLRFATNEGRVAKEELGTPEDLHE